MFIKSVGSHFHFVKILIICKSGFLKGQNLEIDISEQGNQEDVSEQRASSLSENY